MREISDGYCLLPLVRVVCVFPFLAVKLSTLMTYLHTKSGLAKTQVYYLLIMHVMDFHSSLP
jgi:hypothetical protein